MSCVALPSVDTAPGSSTRTVAQLKLDLAMQLCTGDAAAAAKHRHLTEIPRSLPRVEAAENPKLFE